MFVRYLNFNLLGIYYVLLHSQWVLLHVHWHALHYFKQLSHRIITGMYGRVDIIKLFFHHKGSGLIQMGTEAQAASGLLNKLITMGSLFHENTVKPIKFNMHWERNFLLE